MNIEIKHKAKSTHKESLGRWIYGYYAKAQDQSLIIEPSAIPYERTNDKAGLFNPIACPVNEATVCLYSGLKDKNEAIIYTGDVLRLVLPDMEERYFIVDFKTIKREFYTYGGFVEDASEVNITGFVFTWNGLDLFPNDWDTPDNEKMEIAGNIFDSPELILQCYKESILI